MKAFSEAVVFNGLKHHIEVVESFIQQSKHFLFHKQEILFLHPLKHIGNGSFDLYFGSLSTSEIIQSLICELSKKDILKENNFSRYITEHNGYLKCRMKDNSEWIIKYLNNNNQYIHIFPARFSHYVHRSTAIALKTFILFRVFNNNKAKTNDLINHIRLRYLDLPPLTKDQHFRKFEKLNNIIKKDKK